ncbi:MAG: regulatory protein RecX [Dehalococcoidales bacterium]|nr:regulatory protein RecX [Dehalococcoidales bacterium]
MDKVITAIQSGEKPGSGRSRVYLNGGYCFSLDDRIIAEKSLKVGRILTPAEIAVFTRDDEFQRCFTAAIRFINYRSRSISETRERLLKRGFEALQVEAVIGKLKQSGLLDDSSFARLWAEDRTTFKPRSQRVLKAELRRKGVDAGIIDTVVDGSDEEAGARRLAMRKARTLPLSDFQVFRRKLGVYLQRRGFGYDITGRLVRDIWQECTGDQAELNGRESSEEN